MFRYDRNAATSIALSFREPNALPPTAGGPSTGTELELEATAPLLQTESAEVSRAYNTLLIRQLPVQDRQSQELIGLMPGVTPPVTNPDRILDPQRRRDFQVNGLPSFANNYHQDGAYQTDPISGNAIRIAPNEALQSLDVRTSNYNAEYGFSAGAWTNQVTRPGQNMIHGSVFGFHTNSFLNTRNPLDNGSNPVNPRFNQNQFGGSVGGPVWRDSVFAFASYEGFLRRGSTIDIQTVPSSALRNGQFGGGNATIFDPLSGSANGVGRTPFSGNQIPLNRINPFSAGLLGLLPAANRDGASNNLIGSAGLREDNHRGDIKIDHRLSQKAYGFFRYGFSQAEVQRGSVLGALGNAADASLRNHSGVASISYSFNPNLMGELRGGFFRYRNQISPMAATPELQSLLNTNFGGNTFSGGLPQISIGGFSTIGMSSASFTKPITNIWDGATNWVFHTGMHHLKFGASGRVIRASGFDSGLFGPQGSFQFGPGATALSGGTFTGSDIAANSFASFLLGRSNLSGVSSYSTTPTLQQEQYSAHVSDTVTLWSRLSLEIGVRYEVYSPYRTRQTGSNQIFDPASGTISNATANSVYDLNNVAPRAGFALRLFERLAVRGGYGIHYFPLPLAFAGLNQAVTGAQNGIGGGFGSNPTFGLPTVPAGGSDGNNNGSSTAPNLPYTVADRTRQTPYIQTYSFMLQGELGQGFLLDVGYVGNRGRQLPLLSQLNAAAPGAGLTGLPFAQFNRTAATTGLTSGLNSNFNSLQVNLTKRFAKGLSFTGAYTFGKALDYGQSALLSNSNRNLSYGPADFDRRHMLAVSHVWRLPFGTNNRYFAGGLAGAILGDWELNGMLRWATGTPYGVSLDSLACNCPGYSGGLFATSNSSQSANGQTSFDPSTFSVNSNQLGSAGRNIYRGPELFSYDAALFKNFSVWENTKLELRGEVYNVTNNANYASPVSSALLPGFGTSNRLFNDLAGRRFQVAARILF